MKEKEENITVLIVEDDKNTREGLSRALKYDYKVLIAESGEKAMLMLKDNHIDIMLTDLRMPGMDGLTLLQRVLATNSQIVCILLTAYGNVETAVEAMKRGAYDYLTKPVNLDHLDMLLKRAIKSRDMESENISLRKQLDDKYGISNIVGNSAVMQPVFDVINQVAPTQATVLIQGESGTGKELVAHALHGLSSRAKGPYIAVHCAALSDTLLESELFGHEKGSFTGAAAMRKGRFEMADGGTLFLDEISEIDLSAQVKLLRVLEERCFERVGGTDTIDVDIRLVTATNKNLRQLVDEGKFREDLFFRLDVITINLPPLRERGGDISLLCDKFIKELSAINNKNIEGITPDAMNVLSTYKWPGNVRELRNTIEKMVVLARGDKLTSRDLPLNIKEEVQAAGGIILPISGIDGNSLANSEKKMILAALQKCNQNRTKAAEELGISRRTLHRKLKQYDGDNC